MPMFLQTMKNTDQEKKLLALWQRAVTEYEKGNRDAGTYFNRAELDFLASLGMSAGEVYDYAEDHVAYGEPDFATFARIHELRRRYFHEVQQGRPSGAVMSPSDFPAPDAEAAGIPWLPRIIDKARAKLRGELPPDLMYSCPADRRFLKRHDIHPAEFLRKVWEMENDRNKLVEWVARRRNARLRQSERTSQQPLRNSA
jgi:uncharacterized protein DUF5069